MAKEMPDFSHLPVSISRWKLGKHRIIKVHPDFVKVTEQGLNARNWEEPVSAFEGVLRRRDTETRGSGQHSYTVTVHLVELIHPDEKKTLRLYKADEEEGIRKLWEDAARALNLPALDETADGVVARAPEDLGKSIRELAAEGKVSVDFDADALPPKGITCEHAEGEVRATLGLRANSYAVAVGGIIIVGGIFVVFPIWSTDFHFAAVLFGAVVAVGGLGIMCHVMRDALGKRRIVITPREVRYFSTQPTQAIPVDKLKNVRRIGNDLVIESDTAMISIGWLGKQQRRWLEQFILAAVVASPR